MRTLPNPDFYDSRNAHKASYHVTDMFGLQRKAEQWAKRHNISGVGSDRRRVHLLIIDGQVDFSFPEGSLPVLGRSGTGAMDAHQRLVEFGYQHLAHISQVTCTLDTHLPFQVFFPSAHLTETGEHPDPGTIVSADEYKHGKYRPNPAMAKHIGVDAVWLQKQFLHYCQELEKNGKHQLMLWPYHCMIGSDGHRLAGVVEEFRLFHSFARGAENLPEIKGGNPLSERYSVFREEVTTCWDGRPIPGAQKNTAFIETLTKADVVIIAGEAASHCVLRSVEDLLNDIHAQDPTLAEKVYIMTDCMASVVIPNVYDFTDDTEKAFQNFANMGAKLVQSTTPLQDWPGIPNL